jgi:ankyrin repeat protein
MSIRYGHAMSTELEFIEAVKAGERDQAAGLLDGDAALLHAKDGKGVSALLWAVYYGRRDLAGWLVERGWELNLFEAAAFGSADVASRWLRNDPSLANACSADGFTPLMLASFFGNLDLMELLLAHGARVNEAARNPLRVQPLHSAVAHRDYARVLEMARLLVGSGADVNAVQEGGLTPLHHAAAHGQIELARLLLEHGADPSAKTADGQSPLDMAEKGGHGEMARLFSE